MALTKITRELLSTGIDDNSNATAITIDSSERVGINVTSPTAKLSLPAQASGDSGIARFAIESAVDSNDFTIAQYEDGTGTYTQIGQNISLTSGGNVSVLDSAHKTAGITFDGRGNGALMFQTGAANANTEKMRIDSSGRVGIGQTDMSTYDVQLYQKGNPSNLRHVIHNTDGQRWELNSASSGTFYIGNASVNTLIIDSTGAVTKPNQPAFLVTKTSANQDNIAVDTAVQITFNSEIIDQNADFASNTFTAPVTGRYLLSMNLNFANYPNDGNYMWCGIVTSNRTYYIALNNQSEQANAYENATGSVLADMDANDTAYVFAMQGGGTAQTDMQGSSWFSGYLVC